MSPPNPINRISIQFLFRSASSSPTIGYLALNLGGAALSLKPAHLEKLISWTALLCSVFVIVALTIAH